MIVYNVHVFFGHTIMGTVRSPESFVEFRKSRLLLLLYNLLFVATRTLHVCKRSTQYPFASSLWAHSADFMVSIIYVLNVQIRAQESRDSGCEACRDRAELLPRVLCSVSFRTLP